MREIKFRGISQADNIFIYGFYRKCGTEDCVFNNKSSHYVKKGTAGQFTGLKDENKKDIYEGDIVRRQTLCQYKDGPGTIWQDVNHLVGYDGQSFYPDRLKESVVVGNIHENPELLK